MHTHLIWPESSAERQAFFWPCSYSGYRFNWFNPLQPFSTHLLPCQSGDWAYRSTLENHLNQQSRKWVVRRVLGLTTIENQVIKVTALNLSTTCVNLSVIIIWRQYRRWLGFTFKVRYLFHLWYHWIISIIFRCIPTWFQEQESRVQTQICDITKVMMPLIDDITKLYFIILMIR